MKKLIVSLITFMCFLPLIAQQQIAVMDATDAPEVNGLYTENGTYNGKPRYIKDNLGIYFKGCITQWAIDDTNDFGGCPDYSTQVSIPGDLPSEHGWKRYGQWNTRVLDSILMGVPGSLIPLRYYFVESPLSDGSILNDSSFVMRYFFPSGATFSGSVGDNFVSQGKVNVYNLPTGLFAVITKTSDTTLLVTLTGYASSHSAANDIDSVQFEFLDGAFSHNDTSLVENYWIKGIQIFFDRGIFRVSNADAHPPANGYYMEDGTYNGYPLYRNGYFLMGNKNCNNNWVINIGTVSGCPIFASQDNVSIPPRDTWKNGGWGLSNTMTVDPVNMIIYSKKRFFENLSDDGSFNDTLDIQYAPFTNETFTGSNGENYVSLGKATVTNLLPGLSLAIYRTSDTTCRAILTGVTSNHRTKDNIDSLTITFHNTAFSHNNASSVLNSTKNDLNIIFIEKIAVENAISQPAVNGIYSLKGYENNHGIYARNEYRIGYRNCMRKWVLVDGDNDVNIYQGYCPLYCTSTDTKLPYDNDGWAYNFDSDEKIIVLQTNSIQYSIDEIKESLLYNDGSIDSDDTLFICYRYPEDNAYFTGINGDDFIAQGKVIVQNLPEGLIMKLIRVNDTTLYAEFSGQAIQQNDITNFTITLQNSAFSHNDTSIIWFYQKDDFIISFINVFTVASSGADFTTVSNAVSSPLVEDGDHLVLAAETFTVNNLTISKDLTIRGQGPGQTIVQSAAIPGSVNSRIFYFHYSNSRLENMTIRNAYYSSDRGGAIYSSYSVLHLKNCELYDNENSYTYARGGAIYSYYGELYVENCTFYRNSTTGTSTSSTYGGGALNIYHPGSSYKAEIVNSTFYDNHSHNNGGAIWSYGNNYITNTTIVSDTAVNYGGGIYRYSYTTTCLNTLIANNYSLSGPDYYGTVYADYSLIEDNTNTTMYGNNNITGIDPYILPLANNGGLTQTCAIPDSSAAVNAGMETVLALRDQRYAKRSDTTDIGAYEYNANLPFITTETSIGGPFVVSGNQPISEDISFLANYFENNNTFYASLSGPGIFWPGEKIIGEIKATSTNTISTLIDTSIVPLGLANYRVRVKSSNPAITGTESNTFSISVVDHYIYPGDDQVANQSENGDTLRVYESAPPVSRVWKYGTASGVYDSLCGTTDTWHVPNFDSVGTYYIVCISTYGTTDITSDEVKVTVYDPHIIIDEVAITPFHVTDILPDSGIVVYTANGRFTGNTFKAYLSDKQGDFGGEIFLDSLVSDVSDTMKITIPVEMQIGTGYKIRIKSSNPAIISAESDSFGIVYDTVAPSVVLSTTAPNPVNTPITVNINFGEHVRGFLPGDITRTNCSVQSFTTSDSLLFTVVLNPVTNGTFTAQVDSGVAIDRVGLANLKSNLLSRTYDVERPTVEISSSESDTTLLNPFEIEVEFSENVSDFTVSDITVANGEADNLTTITSNRRWTADISPNTKGWVEVRIKANAAQDEVGNNSLSSNEFIIFYDVLTHADEIGSDKTTLYPNPTDGLLFINLGNNTKEIKISLTDITGKELLVKELNRINSCIDLSKLSKGIYFIKLEYNNRVENYKIVVK